MSSNQEQHRARDILVRYCKRLPKIELHAHPNGSIRDSTLLELAQEHDQRGTISSYPNVREIILKEDRSLQECFKLFDVIHVLTTDHSFITRITKEVIEDFAAENVVYLELRTTPKSNVLTGMTKRSYVEAVLAGITKANLVLCENHQLHAHGIQVRLLLSIDRRETTDQAIETVKLALEMKSHGVVGIDLSGNPVTGNWKTFLPALTYARQCGLPVTLHCGEVHNPDEVEEMLAFHPDRLGHACVLQESQWERLHNLRIPVEVCFTSNLRTGCVKSICDHHFAWLYKTHYPLVICTDDRGVFSTNLSSEYAIAATSFDLSEHDLFELAKNATRFIFAEEPLKRHLDRIFAGVEPNYR
ncbi:adenosine deaminase-like protein [Selaginella moellendorffii]|uniref:adenosine deaminase-like protein n=1 Tax=Selaginella moellendorffii TaxID=88036 RepID=UPI000D1C5DDF|nr:adenosine deaminase-like protein [Selaginella moellendorffii]|eukprot:XP_024528011.1 adenosine deaminase-like protein [Selaginella moellendorffii]